MISINKLEKNLEKGEGRKRFLDVNSKRKFFVWKGYIVPDE